MKESIDENLKLSVRIVNVFLQSKVVKETFELFKISKQSSLEKIKALKIIFAVQDPKETDKHFAWSYRNFDSLEKKI